MRLLLIEDDKMLGRATLGGLRTAYAVDWVQSAEDAQEALSTTNYDLLVLDINLPGLSGLEWLARLRKSGDDIPCLFLTARDATYHKVEGLNAGADDYLVKPFDLDELIARCAALLRRAQGRARPTIEHGNISYDPVAKRVTQDGKSVPMSGRELAVLDYLLHNRARIVSKQQIEEHIYDWNSEDIGSNTIEVHISALRRKLGRNLIKTLRNIGYTIE